MEFQFRLSSLATLSITLAGGPGALVGDEASSPRVQVLTRSADVTGWPGRLGMFTSCRSLADWPAQESACAVRAGRSPATGVMDE